MPLLKTRLSEYLNIKHPILLAPMGYAAGGALAAAVTRAGGLGMIGGGYCDEKWILREFQAAEGTRVGCGFITWALRKVPTLLDLVLEMNPAAIMLSFDDPDPFASIIKNANVPLICQVQTVEQAKRSLDLGTDILVAQGSEAGGHGLSRGTITLVPEIVDLVQSRNPKALVLAAGGIADGRGLAAALALGADGVLIGTRFWASKEALIHKQAQDLALEIGGDKTLRTTVTDIARGFDWPAGYTMRLVENDFVRKWHGDENELKKNQAAEHERYESARDRGDYSIAAVVVGEGISMVREILTTEEIVKTLIEDAAAVLQAKSGLVA